MYTDIAKKKKMGGINYIRLQEKKMIENNNNTSNTLLCEWHARN
jgi:hypothetical protein